MYVLPEWHIRSILLNYCFIIVQYLPCIFVIVCGFSCSFCCLWCCFSHVLHVSGTMRCSVIAQQKMRRLGKFLCSGVAHILFQLIRLLSAVLSGTKSGSIIRKKVTSVRMLQEGKLLFIVTLPPVSLRSSPSPVFCCLVPCKNRYRRSVPVIKQHRKRIRAASSASLPDRWGTGRPAARQRASCSRKSAGCSSGPPLVRRPQVRTR